MTQVEPAVTDWAYEQIDANRKAGRDVWVEVSASFYEQAMGVLPPIYRPGGFLVGEPQDHDRITGEPIHTGFVKIGERHFARTCHLSQFAPLAADLRTVIV